MSKQCPDCVESTPLGWSQGYPDHWQYCPECQGHLIAKEVKVYDGVTEDAGTYRITLVADIEFYCEDAAESEAWHSEIGEGGYRPDKVEVKFIRPKATPESHPYKCGKCYLDQETYYGSNLNAYCEWCDTRTWVSRDWEPEDKDDEQGRQA